MRCKKNSFCFSHNKAKLHIQKEVVNTSPSYEKLRDSALSDLKDLMDTLQSESGGNGRGQKLAYWLKDYARFLRSERSFNPTKLIRYKRGSIVKAHLGYNVGCEEGGLHYAIVLDNAPPLSAQVLTVVPLTSIKPGVDITRLPCNRISLGDEVYQSLKTNFDEELASAKARLSELHKRIDEIKAAGEPSSEENAAMCKESKSLWKTVQYCQKMNAEVDKMKTGSIALVGQITTISKIRIYDPCYFSDALAKVRVSDATLDLIDQRIAELYMRKHKTSCSITFLHHDE